MITIEYTINGTYTPFLVILRDTNTNLLVDSKVVHEPNVVQQFVNVPFGNYVIEAYDAANGVSVEVPQNTITTTQSTTLPTTLAPTTSPVFD